MESNPEQRDTSRFRHETQIMFEHYSSGRYYEGRMLNYSRGGMYFESDFAPMVGSEIFIGVEIPPTLPAITSTVPKSFGKKNWLMGSHSFSMVSGLNTFSLLNSWPGFKIYLASIRQLENSKVSGVRFQCSGSDRPSFRLVNPDT